MRLLLNVSYLHLNCFQILFFMKITRWIYYTKVHLIGSKIRIKKWFRFFRAECYFQNETHIDTLHFQCDSFIPHLMVYSMLDTESSCCLGNSCELFFQTFKQDCLKLIAKMMLWWRKWVLFFPKEICRNKNNNDRTLILLRKRVLFSVPIFAVG